MKALSFRALTLLCTIPLTSANFHLLKGLIRRGALEWNEVFYFPSNQYSCDWIKGFVPPKDRSLGKTDIQMPTDVTFTSPSPICGAENMKFVYRESGGFTLEDENGAAGECAPNGGYGHHAFTCGSALANIWDMWDEYYVCYSYACQGM